MLAALLLALCCLGGVILPATAFADNTITFELSDGQKAVVPVVDDRSQRVYDYAGLFSSSEKAELATTIAKIEDKKKCEVMILSTNDVPINTSGSGKSYSRLYAEEFMKQNAENNDAFILEIDMANRKVVAVGHGKYGGTKYNDTMQKITDSLTNDLKEGKYADAARNFLKQVDGIDNILKRLIPTVPSLIISAILAGIVLLILVIIHNSSRAKVEKQVRKEEFEYEQTGHDQIYMGTRTQVRRIERSSGGGSDNSGGGFSGGGGDFSGGESSF